MADELFDVAPFVLVVDRSESMKEVVHIINQFIPEAIDTMRQIPEALESAALGLISFSEDATVVRRMTWVDEELTMPQFVASGLTSYVKPLERTYELIESDTPKLGDRGLPPVVFFVTDGAPNLESEKDWLAARQRLLKSRLRPKLVSFGFGNINETTLKQLASRPDLSECSPNGAVDAIREILTVVTATVITLTGEGSGAPVGSLASRIIESEGDEDDVTIDYKRR